MNENPRHPNGNLLKPNSTLLSLLLRSSDAFIVIASLWLSTFLLSTLVQPHYAWKESYGLISIVAALIYLLLAEYNRLYRAWRITTLLQEINRILVTLAGVIFLVLVFIYTTKTSHYYSRLGFTCWGTMATTLLVLWRCSLRNMLRILRKEGRNTRTAVIAGVSENTRALIQHLEQAPWMGLNIKGVYDDNLPAGSPVWPDSDYVVTGPIEQLITRAANRRADIVFICYSLKEEEQLKNLIADLANTPVQAHIIPSLFLTGLLNAQWEDLGGLQSIDVFAHNMQGVDSLAKRLFDLVFATALLLLLALPMLLIALIIRLQHHSPALFRQRRYGLDGREIRVFKFRTMTVAEDPPSAQATAEDHRITPLGRRLRRCSLDELPQLLNVMKGEMSLVGPRPHAMLHDEQYRRLIDGYILRQKVRPGMTGLAQVNGWRGETDRLEKMEMRIKYDLLYIRNWSLALDIKILFITLFKGFSGKNAR